MKNHLFNYSISAAVDVDAHRIAALGGDPRDKAEIREQMFLLEHRQRFERFLLATKDLDEAIGLLEQYYQAIGERGEATVQLKSLLTK